MNIGSVAERSGVPAKTIRYYESIGLISGPARTEAGYRDYRAEDVQVLRFLRRARGLGFSVEQCRELLSLQKNPRRASARVRSLAAAHLDEVRRKILELKQLSTALEQLVAHCHGDDGPECAILDALAGMEVAQ